MQNNILAVNEIFGPTFQGEGKNLGMPCFFLRLAGCNLACSWCDTRYAWNWKEYDVAKELHPVEVGDVFEKLEVGRRQFGYANLVISGGEPMLQQKALTPLIYALRAKGWWVEIETAGTRPIRNSLAADQFTVSLKLENSGNSLDKRRVPRAIESFARDKRSTFKFVVSNVTDFEEIDFLVRQFGLQPVYIMPEGKNKGDITEHLQAVTQAALQRGYYLTTRLQVLLYGNQRGV